MARAKKNVTATVVKPAAKAAAKANAAKAAGAKVASRKTAKAKPAKAGKAKSAATAQAKSAKVAKAKSATAKPATNTQARSPKSAKAKPAKAARAKSAKAKPTKTSKAKHSAGTKRTSAGRATASSSRNGKSARKVTRTRAEPATLAEGLRAWINAGGDLEDSIPSYHAREVVNVDDATALCEALATLAANPSHGQGSYESALNALTGLFQQAGSQEVFDVLARDGLPHLRAWVRAALAGDPVPDDDVLFILKILVGYGRHEDIALIAEVARKPIAPEQFMWSVVFRFDAKHPGALAMIDALRDPLPEGFIGIAYLDMANQLALAGALRAHPFDSPAGRARLEAWLRDPEHFTYAHSATVALPFIANPEPLLALAAQHPEASVKLEAGWAAAKVGDHTGLQALAAMCVDPNHSSVAQRYLEELGHAHHIPESAREPSFLAMAEMARWLAHPNELGHPPDKIEVYDQRELFWPPTNDYRSVGLVRYVDGEDTGVGMVGSVTFALFGEKLDGMPPEDIYALHCCWELQMNEDQRAPKKRTVKAGRELLARANPGF